MDPTIVVAAFGAAGMIGVGYFTHRKGRRELDALNARLDRESRAATDGVAASAAQAVQDVYQEVINDLRAQVAAAAAEAMSARDAARAAQRMAEEAEHNSWKAESWARSMERFLVELRPVLAHLPDGAAWMARADAILAAGPHR